MSMISSKQSALFGLTCLLVLGWGLNGLGQAGKPGQVPEAGKDYPKPKRLYFGVSACAGCHEEPPKSEMPPLVCDCHEYTTWMKDDKHKLAYQKLESDRAKRMGDLLRKDVTKTEVGCIQCHGIDVPKEHQEDRSFKLSDGVSCVVCHGAYENWVVEHQISLPARREKWRGWTRKQKQELFGMTDLWNPATRTQMCASCHVGNRAENKFVTHDMYAAGHPPLPAFEIATFSEKMPRHWKYIREKDRKVQEIQKFEPDSQRYEQTQLVAVSSIMTLAEAVRLVGADAAKVAEPKDGGERAMDFANFDCYACHHDLKSPSWRQERGYLGKPGRPQMRPWPVTLAKISLEELLKDPSKSKDLDNQLKELTQAFDAQPFGDCKAIPGVAKKLADALTALAKELSAGDTRSYEAKVPGLLRRICAVPEQTIPDYDTARQLAWAFEIIYYEWKPLTERDAAIVKEIEELKKELKLDLPSGRKRDITDELPTSLKVLNDYDPAKFKAHMQKLAELLRQMK